MDDYPIPLNVLLVGEPFADQNTVAVIEEVCPNWTVTPTTSLESTLEQMNDDDTIDAVIGSVDSSDLDAKTLSRTTSSVNPRVALVLTSAHRMDSTQRHTFANAIEAGASNEPIVLKRAVERGVNLKHRLYDPELTKLIDSIDALPSPTGIVQELSDTLNDPNASIDSVAAIIERDTAMTAKMLQLVNSAGFALNRPIATLDKAIPYIGFSTIYSMLSAVELANALSSMDGSMRAVINEHSVHSQAVAEIAASMMPANEQSEAFVGGLLHDMGLLALSVCSPAHYLALKEEALHSGRSLELCELDVLGTTHAAIGAYMAQQWGLPQILVEAVARSHDADRVPLGTPKVVNAVFVAEQIANLETSTGRWWEGSQPLDNSYLARQGLRL